MHITYTVALAGGSAIPGGERIAAEIRFVKALERALGGREQTVAVFRAWQEASDADASELTAEASRLAVKWPRAFDLARQAGMKGIGDEEAHFELRLEKAEAAPEPAAEAFEDALH